MLARSAKLIIGKMVPFFLVDFLIILFTLSDLVRIAAMQIARSDQDNLTISDGRTP